MSQFDTPQMYRWRDPSWPPHFPALAVYFAQEPFVNAEVTAATGVQSYDNVLMAYVAPMGMPKSNASCEIERTLPDGTVKRNAENSAKYAEQVKHFKAGTSAETIGTPLRDLVGMTPALSMNLKARGLHTVEMLAETPDSMAGEMMGFWEWRDRARAHLKARQEAAPTVRLELELAEQKKVNGDLQRQIEELAALVNKPEKPERQKKAA